MSDRKKALSQIGDLLSGSNQILRQVAKGASDLKPFQHAWSHLLPESACDHVRPAFFTDGKLTVWVDSPLWANWVRHRHDSLTTDIEKQGLPKVHTLIVRLSPEIFVTGTTPEQKRPNNHTEEIITQTAQDIADPELRKSLQKLAKTLGNSR